MKIPEPDRKNFFILNCGNGFCVLEDVNAASIAARQPLPARTFTWLGRPAAAFGKVADKVEERQLVQRCLGGEARAWEEIVRRHSPRLYQLCLRFTGNSAQAEDLAQDALLRIYRALTSYDPAQGSLATWMTALTRNLLIDHYRRSRLERSTDSLDDPNNTPPAPVESRQRQPDAGVWQRELRDEVQAALARLSPELREAVILRDLQDYDYKEIAAVLRIPEGTVKSRINRGRIELARHLAPRLRKGTRML